MSSGFVPSSKSETYRDTNDDWRQAQDEIDTAAARKAEARSSELSSRKSLYEVLEANKAAKQEAFEEATRLRNQFRALDEDEIDFLDSVLEGTRAEEARVKKEILLGVRSFHQQQVEADQKARSISNLQDLPLISSETSWMPVSCSRKRKRNREKIDGVKLSISKRVSSTKTECLDTAQSTRLNRESCSPRPRPLPNGGKLSADTGSSLVNYGSDDDDW